MIYYTETPLSEQICNLAFLRPGSTLQDLLWQVDQWSSDELHFVPTIKDVISYLAYCAENRPGKMDVINKAEIDSWFTPSECEVAAMQAQSAFVN